ncbi:MAG: hypothetical protein ACMUEL_06580 [Flavobacteriales bacterium Tduv]
MQYYSEYPCSKGCSYLRSVGSKGRGPKASQSKKQGEKRDSIKSRHSRKMAQEIR